MLNDQLNGLIMEAMKDHNEVRTRTLRAIKAAFIEGRTAKGAGEMDEAKEIQILQKMVKQREDACQQYVAVGRQELADNEQAEMQIIREFLPKPVSREEIEAYLKACPNRPASMGEIIKLAKAQFPAADGKMVAEVAKSLLA